MSNIRIQKKAIMPSSFHLDKKISISMIFSLLMAVATGIWAVADSRSQLDSLQRAMGGYRHIPIKVVRLEEKVDRMQEDVRFIRQYLVRVKE